MDLQIVILSEVSQRRETSHDIHYKQNLKRHDTNKHISNTDSELESKPMFSGGSLGGRDS